MTAQDQTVVAIAMLVTGAVMLLSCLPLVYRKVAMNRFYGIRVREAFKSSERWFDINAYGGRQFAMWSWPLMLIGLIGLALPAHFVFIYVPVAVAAILVSGLTPLIQTIRWIKATGPLRGKDEG